MRFLTLQRPPPEMSFREFKGELVDRAREFVQGSGKCRELIAHNMSEFIRDGSVRLFLALLLICTHAPLRRPSSSTLTRFVELFLPPERIVLIITSPSQRVVVQALLFAAQTQKKRFSVYVTESRPVSPACPTSLRSLR